ncbi:MAG: MarR family transcriptional regulator [Actinomycetota bacterium]|nr:MarR family transcriptional regulator [Actinomycetota bacterium]
MRFDSPLDDVFLNRSHVRTLRALYHLPEGLPASGREIARRAGVTHPTALRALAVLAEAGLVTIARSSSGEGYELNRDHFFSDQIAGLYQADARVKGELVTYLARELLARTDKVEWATLFGSIAWGETTPTSDIDVAVSCAPAAVDEVENALTDLSDGTRRQFGNHVSPLINTRQQRSKSGIWKRIEEEGVPLIRSGKAISP